MKTVTAPASRARGSLLNLRACFSILIAGLSMMAAGSASAQIWATNGPLQVPRWSHTETAQADGTVLIVDGEIYNIMGDLLDTNAVESYDPSTGISTLVSPTTDTRHSASAIMLNDGTTLVAGAGSSEVWDPVGQQWINYQFMNDYRMDAGLIILPNGDALSAAGTSGATDLATAEVYDPNMQTWTYTTGTIPYATDSMGLVMMTNGLALLVGGSDGMGGSVTNCALFNYNTGTWTYAAPLNEPRVNAVVIALTNGLVLAAGGAGDNTAELYNPALNTWTFAGSMNDSYYNAVGVTLTNGNVLFMEGGGTNVEIYSVVSNTWSWGPALPVDGNFQAAATVANGNVVVSGGSVSQFNGPPESVIETFTTAPSNVPVLAVTNSPSTGAAPLTVQFTSPATDSKGNTVTNWSWSFGDGGNSPSRSPAHIYTNAGNYNPTLTALSTYGSTPLTVTGLGTITVTNDAVTVSITPPSGPAPLTVQFVCPGTDGLGLPVTNFSWSFGDGGNSSLQNPSHIYATNGFYNPTLTARSTHSSSPLAVNGLFTITVTNSPNQNFQTLYTFNSYAGTTPFGSLSLLGGRLYGTTGFAVFSVSTNGSGFTNVAAGLNGVNAKLALVGGSFYGTTSLGGTNGAGSIFSFPTSGGSVTTNFSFVFNLPSPAEQPVAGLIASGGTLFGTTFYGGGSDEGTVFSILTNGTDFAGLVNFAPGFGESGRANATGLSPYAPVTLAVGTLYGTTESGGASATGVLFSVNTNSPSSFAVLHQFNATGNNGTNADGAFPFNDLAVSNGFAYGVARFGGTAGYGTIYTIPTNGSSFTTLYSFTNGTDGANPYGGLLLSGTTLYGVASGGGADGAGTIYSIQTNGSNFTLLYTFTGGADGSVPVGDLLLSGGVLYGCASQGGAGTTDGTVFAFTLPGPTLDIAQSGPNVILTWTAAVSGYTLQSSPTIGPAASWSTVVPSPVIINGSNTVTNLIAPNAKFYRLFQ
jgi:uncharacterized repeat protein (TIGR03803 family)